MSDHTPKPSSSWPPPPPDASAAAAGFAEQQAPIRPAWVVVAAAIALASVLASGIGFGIGFAVGESTASGCTPTDGWCDLGAVLVGLAAGVLAACITYIAAGVVTIRRLRPKGHRSGPVTALIAAPPVVFIGLSILDALVNALV